MVSLLLADKAPSKTKVSPVQAESEENPGLWRALAKSKLTKKASP
jgi:hypothetical protein